MRSILTQNNQELNKNIFSFVLPAFINQPKQLSLFLNEYKDNISPLLHKSELRKSLLNSLDCLEHEEYFFWLNNFFFNRTTINLDENDWQIILFSNNSNSTKIIDIFFQSSWEKILKNGKPSTLFNIISEHHPELFFYILDNYGFEIKKMINSLRPQTELSTSFIAAISLLIKQNGLQKIDSFLLKNSLPDTLELCQQLESCLNTSIGITKENFTPYFQSLTPDDFKNLFNHITENRKQSFSNYLDEVFDIKNYSEFLIQLSEPQLSRIIPEVKNYLHYLCKLNITFYFQKEQSNTDIQELKTHLLSKLDKYKTVTLITSRPSPDEISWNHTQSFNSEKLLNFLFLVEKLALENKLPIHKSSNKGVKI